MTAHNMSSAPTTQDTFSSPEDVYEKDAARHTEEFLANLVYNSHDNEHDGYSSQNDDPVHVTANMMENDDLWILSVKD
jgi:hypothetical protein